MQERGKPKFDQKQVLPEVPEGMELYRFHGQPVLIPSRTQGESLVGNSTYTQRQIDRLVELEFERIERLKNDFDSRSEDLFLG